MRIFALDESVPQPHADSLLLAHQPLLPFLPPYASRKRLDRIPRKSAPELDPIEDLVGIVLARDTLEQPELHERVDLRRDRDAPEGVLEAGIDD